MKGKTGRRASKGLLVAVSLYQCYFEKINKFFYTIKHTPPPFPDRKKRKKKMRLTSQVNSPPEYLLCFSFQNPRVVLFLDVYIHRPRISCLFIRTVRKS